MRLKPVAIIVSCALSVGCLQSVQPPRAACGTRLAVGNAAAAIEIAQRAAELPEPKLFVFRVEADEQLGAYFVRIIEKAKPDEFFASVIVNSCDGSAQLHGPL